MARKVILDIDPGIHGALLLCIALFDPSVEVLAVTSSEGDATASLSAQCIMGLIELLDPPKIPRFGFGSPPDFPIAVPSTSVHGMKISDTFLPELVLCTPPSAEKVIGDTLRTYPHEVTILTGGPLTNIARVFRRDPNLACLVDRLIVCGGTYTVAGNITPSAEVNIYRDPISAQEVLSSSCTITLVPLDITCQIPFELEFFTDLPDEQSPFGRFVRHLFLTLFRAYRQEFGMEQIYLPELIAYYAMTAPELFTTIDASGKVETEGKLTRGATVFDRRVPTPSIPNMEVALELNHKQVRARILSALQRSAQAVKMKES